MGFSIAKESAIMAFTTIVISVIMLALGFRILGLFLFVIFLLELFFFRDPDRRTPDVLDGKVLSPADGRILKIDGTKVSIFMSLFNVHVNRSPVEGEIVTIRYRKGAFRAAFLERAQQENERNSVVLKTHRGSVSFTQIAGVIARRIVCGVREGQRVAAGQRVGMIMFGSRIDVEFADSATMNVCIGERVKAGVSVIATMHDRESAR